MSTRIRGSIWVALGVLALGAAPLVQAGVNGKMIEKMKERDGDDAPQRQSAPAPAPQSKPAPGYQQRMERSRADERARSQAPRPAPQSGGSATPRRDRDRDTGVVGGMVQRNYDTRGDRDDRGEWRGNRGNGGGYSRDYRPPRVVRSLPPGYRHYNWNGRPYYHYRGGWYRPYGSSFISIGVPYGLFVTTLPGYHTSFWFGGSRYFYADDTYYLWEPARRGYVVARSPYDDDRETGDAYAEEAADEDLFIYPARGQSEQQQADDRYECHRWAAKESGYDPIDDEYDPDRREDYLRAMTACLTGRGYSVK